MSLSRTQESLEKISNSVTAIYKETIAILQELTPNRIPKAVVKGTHLLPIYACFNVLQNQSVPISNEQDMFLRTYFATIDVGFSLQDFMNSVRYNNNTRQEMWSNVGISESFAGEYWIAIFRAIKRTANSGNSLVNLVHNYNTIVSDFELMSGIFTDLTSDHRKEFIDAVYYQLEKIESKSETEDVVDVYGEKSIEEHYLRMKEITGEIIEKGQDDEILDQLFGYFTVGLLATFLEKLPIGFKYKCEVLTSLTKDLNIGIGFSSDDVLLAINTGNDLDKFTYQLVNNWADDSINYWVIQGIAAKKGDCQQLTLEFAQECTSFLLGVELKLKIIFPDKDFGGRSVQIGSDIIGHIADLYR